MALLNYPLAWGYQQWRAWRAYSSDRSPFEDTDFIPAGLPIPVRPQGVLLWRGVFTTPIYGPRDPQGDAVRALMESLDQGVNTLTLPVPVDQRNTGILGESLTVQPVTVDPSVRDSRGIIRGWTVEWVEIP